MHILLSIHHHLDPDAGAPGAVMALAREFEKQGHQVQVCSFDNLSPHIPAKLKPLIYPYYLAWYIRENARNGKRFDIIDASTGDAWVWGVVHPLGNERRPMLVTHSHGLEHIAHRIRVQESENGRLKLSWKYPIYHGGIRLMEVTKSLRVANVVSFLNCKESQFAIETLGIPEIRTCVIPNGIDEAFLGLPASFEQENIDSIGIAQVGSYISRKGIYYSALALNQILEKYPRVHVGFFGTGCTRDYVLSNFETQFHSRIQVLPHYKKPELRGLLRDYQIKLFPTLSEGFGLALVESMACGLAPIATNVDGPSEIVTDGVNGLLIPPRDSEAIVNSIERLLNSRALLERLRRAAYNSAQEYSWFRVASLRLERYRQLYALN